MTRAPEIPAGARVAHQFNDSAQQKHAVLLGMWTFLATEVVLFGGLIASFVICRVMYGRAFSQAGSHLYAWIGITNTAVLLTSSAFVALAVETDPGRNRRRSLLLSATALLGLCFLGLKGVEYGLDVHEGILPRIAWRPEQFADASRAELFMLFYWLMTGLHALHVSAGIAVIGVLAWRSRRAEYAHGHHNTIEAAGLYWHFVDIVWLFLLPLLYLGSPP
ncbi:MAG TPA: cytochrome c oxidase subunit 3 [Phycisphaerales bacterium]|nr:cytochrome c oxidase subunit 3 [Phycisphaerales bacterium]